MLLGPNDLSDPRGLAHEEHVGSYSVLGHVFALQRSAVSCSAKSRRVVVQRGYWQSWATRPHCHPAWAESCHNDYGVPGGGGNGGALLLVDAFEKIGAGGDGGVMIAKGVVAIGDTAIDEPGIAVAIGVPKVEPSAADDSRKVQLP